MLLKGYSTLTGMLQVKCVKNRQINTFEKNASNLPFLFIFLFWLFGLSSDAQYSAGAHPPSLTWSSTQPCSLRNSFIHSISVSEENLSEQVTPLEVCVSVCDICLMCACGPQGEK